MSQIVPLCDSPYSLPHLIVAQLLGQVLRYSIISASKILQYQLGNAADQNIYQNIILLSIIGLKWHYPVLELGYIFC